MFIKIKTTTVIKLQKKISVETQGKRGLEKIYMRLINKQMVFKASMFLKLCQTWVNSFPDYRTSQSV